MSIENKNLPKKAIVSKFLDKIKNDSKKKIFFDSADYELNKININEPNEKEKIKNDAINLLHIVNNKTIKQ